MFMRSYAFCGLVAALLLHVASPLHAETVTAVWDPSPDADVAGYKLSYGTQRGVYGTTIDVGKVTTTPITVAAGQRYFFAVQAYNSARLSSPYSAEVSYVVPLSAGSFTDDPRGAGLVSIAVHITELRARIDAVRSRLRLSGFSWTDPAIAPGMTIEARHIIELRTALSQAYLEAGIALPIYTDDPPMVGGTLIRATHITEPRTALLVIE